MARDGQETSGPEFDAQRPDEMGRALNARGNRALEHRRHDGCSFYGILSAPGAPRTWREVLGVRPQKRDRSIVRQAYRRMIQQHHPDRPGSSHNAMTELNAALATAESELKEQKEC